MIYLVLGLPGQFSKWCADALAHLLQCNGAAVIKADLFKAPLDEAGLLLIKNRGAHLVLCSCASDAMLDRLLREESVRFVLALEDPKAVYSLHIERGAEPLTALRQLATFCPSLLAKVEFDGALKITAEQAAENSIAVVHAMARHLGIDTPAASLSLVPPYCSDVQSILVNNRNDLIDGALAPYSSAFRGGALLELIWSRELFTRTQAPTLGLSAPINLRDIANGHFLVHGPYLPVPAGAWSAQLVLGFSADAVGQTMAIDVCNNGIQLADTKFLVRQSGIMSHSISFSVAKDENVNLELRILVGRNSAPGQMAFGRVVLRLMGASLLAANSNFLEALTL